jgi:hypothetical protein
VTKKSPKDEN